MEAKRGRGGRGIYIINYDFITWSQFLWDLLFRGALMNNKKRAEGEEEAKKKKKTSGE